MKTLLKTIALTALVLLPLQALMAETDAPATRKVHRVVFEVTSDGAEKWLAALKNVENAQKSVGAAAAHFEVVVHGKGLGMLLARNAAENKELGEKLESLHSQGVIFAACENTMKRDKVEKTDLVSHATTVDSGVGEVIRKQAEGYAYIKIGS